nr:ribonuclease H-like domain-containing protein [Tanacetum cinerariifolium]
MVVPSSKGRLNLLYMDLCGPMRVVSINGKKYILVTDIKEKDKIKHKMESVEKLIKSKPKSKSNQSEPSMNLKERKKPKPKILSFLEDKLTLDELIAIAITLDLPTVEPEDSLRKGDEHLNTISETKSDEFIKSSVENLVPNPSEFEDDSECDVPAYDDFTTFSNLLFDVDDDFSSRDDKLFSDQNIPKEIYSNSFFDEEIISIKIDPLILFLMSSPVNSFFYPEEEIRLIEKLLYDNSSTRPLEEFISENSDAAIEYFSQSPIRVKDSDSLMDEIDLSFTLDDSMPRGIEDDDYDSERDILILEELLGNDSLLLPENESFHFDILSFPRPPAKQPDDDEIKPNSRILTIKVEGDIFEYYVPMQRLLPAQPTLASGEISSSIISSWP